MQMNESVKFQQLRGYDRLFLDYIQNFEKVKQFYSASPSSIESFKKIIQTQTNFPHNYSELASILYEQNEMYGHGDATRRNIELLGTGKCFAVVTGQQVGLFSGPLYTIYKILTAIKLSHKLSEQFHIPVVPIFWLASDDHDFDEVNHVYILDNESRLIKIEYQDDRRLPKTPIFFLTLKNHISSIISEIEQRTHKSEWKPKIIENLHNFFSTGKNWVTAVAQFLTYLFKDYGLILVDPSDSRLKKLGRSVFEKEIMNPVASSNLVKKVGEQLQQFGYPLKINLTGNCLNLFYIDEQQRQTIFIINDHFQIQKSKKRFNRNQMIKELDKGPEKFSPNVVTRPLFQDVLFPTIAYIAGPNELSYHAQLLPVYRFFEIPPPILYPRCSVSIIEKKFAKLFDKYTITPNDIMLGADQLLRLIISRRLSPSIQEKLESLSKSIETQFAMLQNEIKHFDASLCAYIENSHNRIQNHIKNIEKKMIQSYKRRHSIMEQQVHQLCDNFFPESVLQERKINILPYIFKYNPEFISRLYRQIDISQFRHKYLYL